MSRSKRKAKQYNSPSPEIIRLNPANDAQGLLMESIRKNPVTIATGSPGTGKTLIALHEAVWMLHNREIEQILYLKPNVPVGKSIGFLPGTVDDKLDPMFYPIKDNITVFCTDGKADIMLRKKLITIFPQEYIRGRSIRNTFVILDEAQNCDATEVKTTISRLGEGSKLVITGDNNQQDSKGNSGLSDAVYRLRGLSTVGIVQFEPKDVVRNHWLQSVLERY